MSREKITKVDLVETVYEQVDCEKQVVQSVIESFLSSLKESIMDGASIELRGFGSFTHKKRLGRKNARNPRTGEIVEVDPHTVVVFRPGKEIKASVRDLESDT